MMEKTKPMMEKTKPKCSECPFLEAFFGYTYGTCHFGGGGTLIDRLPKTHPRWCPLLKKGNKKEKAD